MTSRAGASHTLAGGFDIHISIWTPPPIWPSLLPPVCVYGGYGGRQGRQALLLLAVWGQFFAFDFPQIGFLFEPPLVGRFQVNSGQIWSIWGGGSVNTEIVYSQGRTLTFFVCFYAGV